MISRARVMRWMRAMEAARQTEVVRLVRNNSTILGPTGFTQKDGLSPDHPDYKAKVAEPTMEAVDSMPAEWRLQAVANYGYVDVYRAWKRNWPLSRVKDQAERMGGRFVL